MILTLESFYSKNTNSISYDRAHVPKRRSLQRNCYNCKCRTRAKPLDNGLRSSFPRALHWIRRNAGFDSQSKPKRFILESCTGQVYGVQKFHIMNLNPILWDMKVLEAFWYSNWDSSRSWGWLFKQCTSVVNPYVTQAGYYFLAYFVYYHEILLEINLIDC